MKNATVFRPDPKPTPKPKKALKPIKRSSPKRVAYMGVLMPVHTAIYYGHFNITPGDYVQCECCPKQAVDINHIKSRGMGGSKTKDFIENLMAMCRECHQELGDRKDTLYFLIEKHSQKLRYGIAELLTNFEV